MMLRHWLLCAAVAMAETRPSTADKNMFVFHTVGRLSSLHSYVTRPHAAQIKQPRPPR